jgi:hypothetical protein
MTTLMELRDEYDVFLRQEVSVNDGCERGLQRCCLTNECFLSFLH